MRVLRGRKTDCVTPTYHTHLLKSVLPPPTHTFRPTLTFQERAEPLPALTQPLPAFEYALPSVLST